MMQLRCAVVLAGFRPGLKTSKSLTTLKSLETDQNNYHRNKKQKNTKQLIKKAYLKLIFYDGKFVANDKKSIPAFSRQARYRCTQTRSREGIKKSLMGIYHHYTDLCMAQKLSSISRLIYICVNL